MNMISLIDIINSVDEKKKPIGHGIKLLRDLPYIFNEKVEILASKKYIEKLTCKGIALPFCTHLGVDKNESLKVMCNYLVSLVMAKGEILIYTVTRESLLWGIALFKGKRKIVAVTYMNWDKYIRNNLVNNPLRRFLVEKGLSRLDGCIVTNHLYTPKVPCIRVPDYYITDELKEYMNTKKKYGCVCLGEVRKGKDVVGLVREIGKTDIPLLIAGSFRDKRTYRKIERLQTNNIKIRDCNLPYEIYLKYLSLYKYIVLPYDARCYDGITSGVLLEGIFLGAVPIAPKSLLEQNQIQGLGYQAISEIPQLIQSYEKGNIFIEYNLEKYYLESYKSKVNQFIREIRKSNKV